MGLRFRETYGLLRFGARNPARHQSHGSLVPWPDSVPVRLPHFGVDLQRKKQKFNRCSPTSCGSEFSMVPTADGSQRTKLVAPHFHTAFQHPHVPASSSGWKGGVRDGELLADHHSTTGSRLLFAFKTAEVTHCDWLRCLFFIGKGGEM